MPAHRHLLPQWTNLEAVWGTNKSNVFTVGGGENGGLLHHDGGPMWWLRPVKVEKALSAVWGSAASKEVFAVGDRSAAYYDGEQWFAKTSPQ